MAPVPNIKLNSGYEMPQVGFGLWKVDNAVASDVVYDAIKAGYRLFDGACGTLTSRRKFTPPPPFQCTPFPSPTKMAASRSGEEKAKTPANTLFPPNPRSSLTHLDGLFGPIPTRP